MRPIERPRSIAGEVVNTIRQAIINGDLKLGQELSERQLAENLGVSKTPVREALAQLRLEGLVRIYPQKGATVFTLSAIEIREICELRQALEAAALRHSMNRNPNDLIKSLAETVEVMQSAQNEGDVKAYLAADTTFHLNFFEACGNTYLLETYTMHLGKIAALRTHLAQKPQHTQMSFEEHLDMVNMLKNDKLAEALVVLDQHINRTKTSYSNEIEDIAAADSARGAEVR